MATSWLFRAAFAGCFGAGMLACTLLTGVNDLSVGAGGDAGTDAIVPVPTTTGTVPPPPNGDDDDQDAGGSDAALFGDVNSTTVDACSPTGCLPVPDGFVLVALGPKGADCPTGFTGSAPVDVIENEAVDPSACSCGCTVTNAGKCPGGMIADSVSVPEAGTNACTQQLGTVNGNGGCQFDGFVGPFEKDRYRQYTPQQVQPQEQACAGNTNKVATRVGGTSERVCTASVVPACNSLVCPSDPGGGFKACIASSGAVQCPAEWPVSHPVGTGISFDCDGTGCGCAGVTGTCNGGTLSFFTSFNCMGTAGFVTPVNGACAQNPMADGTTHYNSHQYAPNPPANVACSANGSATVTNTAIAQASTVCCTN